jgi:hypothetical protein
MRMKEHAQNGFSTVSVDNDNRVLAGNAPVLGVRRNFRGVLTSLCEVIRCFQWMIDRVEPKGFKDS